MTKKRVEVTKKRVKMTKKRVEMTKKGCEMKILAVFQSSKCDELVKCQFRILFVIPAKAGIQ